MAYIKIRHRERDGFESGKYHDDDALRTVINYVVDPKKTINGLIGGVGVNAHNAIYEMEALSTSCAQNHGVRLRHMILSFDCNDLQYSRTDSAQMAYRLAYKIAKYYGSEYQIMYAVHENTSRIHVHFVMNTVSYMTGLKYAGTKSDLHQFLCWSRGVLEPYNIELHFLKDIDDWDRDEWGP